ncbi:MAG: hypothetical protein RLP09_35385 [Sandaracinaceae bacterium]
MSGDRHEATANGLGPLFERLGWWSETPPRTHGWDLLAPQE